MCNVVLCSPDMAALRTVACSQPCVDGHERSTCGQLVALQSMLQCRSQGCVLLSTLQSRTRRYQAMLSDSL